MILTLNLSIKQKTLAAVLYSILCCLFKSSSICIFVYLVCYYYVLAHGQYLVPGSISWRWVQALAWGRFPQKKWREAHRISSYLQFPQLIHYLSTAIVPEGKINKKDLQLQTGFLSEPSLKNRLSPNQISGIEISNSNPIGGEFGRSAESFHTVSLKLIY